MPQLKAKKQAWFEWRAMSEVDKVAKGLPLDIKGMCDRLGIDRGTGYRWDKEWEGGKTGEREENPESKINEIMENLRRLSRTHPTAGKAYIEAHKLLEGKVNENPYELSADEYFKIRQEAERRLSEFHKQHNRDRSVLSQLGILSGEIR